MFLCPRGFYGIIALNKVKGRVKMAREARKISSKGMYTVILRGERLFKGEEDRKVFLELLERYFEGGEVFGYDLSDREIRLVVKETPKGISMTMKPLITSYARYFNRTHNTEGKLFSGRFISEPIESEKERDEAVVALSSPAPLRKARTTGDTKAVKKSAAKPAKKTGDTKKEEKSEEVKPVKKQKKNMPSYLL